MLSFTHPRRNLLLAIVSAMILVWGTVTGLAQAGEAGALTEAEVRKQLAECLTLPLESPEQYAKISSLADTGSPLVAEVLTAWRQGEVFLQTMPDGAVVPFQQIGSEYVRVDSGEKVAKISQTAKLKSGMKLGRAIRSTIDLLSLADPNPSVREASILKLGMSQNAEYLAALQARESKEKEPKVKLALTKAVSLVQMKNGDSKTRVEAINTLGQFNHLDARDIFTALEKDPDKAVAEAAKAASTRLLNYERMVEFCSSIVRGLGTGSVLLIATLGLAITFGLMGVINMAHGELIAVGAYTTYVVQCFFSKGVTLPMFGANLVIPGLNLTGGAYDWYFVASLPAAFLVSALVGIALERGIIQFLYKRPLESLLATWGVAMIMQQSFRLMFGAQNVPMNAPTYMSGSWTVSDVNIGWNRLCVILFAALIVVLTYLLLTKTPLGLLIRSVMQNREMASCMGVRTEKVNMLTFGFGSGLAGLAGAFISQLDNVGPEMGKNYIVDAFMTVVVGGVGNLVGTILSSVGIGMTDQMLQPALGPVLGKIILLFAIILFLQWKPGGLFPTRSRSLEG